MSTIQDVRDTKASHFIQMVQPMGVIVYDEQLIQDKDLFIRLSLDTILEGHVDHIDDIQDIFLCLLRFYFEHTVQIVVE